MDLTTVIPEIVTDGNDTITFYELTPLELIGWCLIYGLIAFLAIVGNLVVLYITLFRLRVRSITTYFILNLGFADLFTGVFAIPFKFQAALFQEWFLPRPLCRIVPYVETVALTVSVFTLVVSAIHEFRTMFFSKCVQMSPKYAKKVVFAIWIMSIVVSLPHGLFHHIEEFLEVDNVTVIVQCLPIYPEARWWKHYNIYLVVIQYFVPMIILDMVYGMIGVKLWSISKARIEMDETKEANQKISIVSMLPPNNQLTQLMKTLIIVVICFTLCWLPLETYLLLNELQPDINKWKYINLVFFFSHWLAMSNSCLNPIIYGLYNTKYNEEYRRLFRQIRCLFWQGRKSVTDPVSLASYGGTIGNIEMKPERRWNSSNDCRSQHEIDQIVDGPPVVASATKHSTQ